MFFMPESPYALLQKGKEEQGAKSLQWLRGKKYDITDDLDQMKRTVQVNSLRNKSIKEKTRLIFAGAERDEERLHRRALHHGRVPEAPAHHANPPLQTLC